MPAAVPAVHCFFPDLPSGEQVTSKESIAAVCEGLIFHAGWGVMLRQLWLKGQVKAVALSALAQGQFCCQSPSFS